MTERIATAHQANFLPGASVMSKVAEADVVIWEDELQFTRGFENRNRLPSGKWITVSVEYGSVGEPLNRVTRLVPAGRGPFLTWTDGAVDALKLQGFDKVVDWSIEHALYLAEEYNGFGYAWKGLPSPYVWGATNLQKPGKYVADGKFDANVMDSQIGVAALLQIISALVGGILPGLVNDVIKSQTSGAGVTVTPTSANTGMLSIAIGALMAGLGATSFGVDAIHTVTTIAGVAVAILSWVNHAGLIGASNANTEALVEQLLTQIASYQPPVSAVAGVPEGGDALKG